MRSPSKQEPPILGPGFRAPLMHMTNIEESESLSLRELLAALDAHGSPATEQLLKRYRSNGLLRCLGQTYPAGLQGSRSLYPPSAVDQVVLVKKLGLVDRRYEQRRILVAWHGGWVEPAALRSSLEKVLDRFSEKVRDAIEGIDDPWAAAELLMRQERERSSPPATKLLRQRLGGSWRRLQSVMLAFAVLSLGGEIDWRDHDPASTEESLEHLIERATATERTRTEPLIKGRALIPDADDAKKVITDLLTAGTFDVRDLASSFRSADDEMIARGFRDAHTISDLSLFAEAVEADRGPDAGGLGAARLLAPNALDAFTVALLVRAALIFRKAVPDAAFSETASALNSARGPLTALLEIRRSLPAHADVLGLDYQSRLAELPAACARRVEADVTALLDSRPDIMAMLTARARSDA